MKNLIKTVALLSLLGFSTASFAIVTGGTGAHTHNANTPPAGTTEITSPTNAQAQVNKSKPITTNRGNGQLELNIQGANGEKLEPTAPKP